MTSLRADLAVAAGRLRTLTEGAGVPAREVEREWSALLEQVEDSRSRGAAELALAVARDRWERRWGAERGHGSRSETLERRPAGDPIPRITPEQKP
jgi:hypothetical protein